MELPIWLEYAKALGAPVVAVVAAVIAGVIAYRQWITARNKLKLDLFDRRLKIYTDAFAVIKWMAEPDLSDRQLIWNLEKSYAESRWLLGEEVTIHLRDLFHRGFSSVSKDPNRNVHLSQKERQERGIEEALEALAVVQKELQILDALFERYLHIKD